MQKTILDIVKTVSAEFNLPVPTSVISSQDASVLKILALVRATCDDLVAEYDWQQLQTAYSFTTTAGIANYSLPVDVQRFTNLSFFDQSNRWKMNGPISATGWGSLKVSPSSGPFERFRIFNNQLYLTPTPGTSPYTFNYEYVSNSYVRDGSSGLLKQDFSQDSDVCLFDHRVVVYGAKYKWLGSIGSDNSNALSEFNRALEFSKGGNMPSGKLNLGGPADDYRFISNANFADGSWVV
jgi:hypothetical protein